VTETVPPARNAPQLTRKQLVVIFCLALALLFTIVVFVWQESRREAQARNVVTHTLQVLKQTIELENVALTMETSQRGYLISGRPDMLANRNASYIQAARLADELAVLVNDNDAQVHRVRQGKADLEKRYATMQATSAFAARNGLPAARERFRFAGDGSIEPMRKKLAALRLEENRLLTERLAIYEQRVRKFQWLLATGTFLALAILIATVFALFRQLSYSEQVAIELEQSNEKLRFAYEVSKIGDWELNLVSGKTQRSLMHDQVFGYAEGLPDWSYEIFKNCVHPDDLERVDAAFNKAVQAGVQLAFECRVFWPDRSLHWIAVRGRTFERSDGDRSRMLGTIGDITVRKEAEQAILNLNRELLERTVALQASNQELESFSYSVSHDLRAPLRHIDGYARMLLEDAAEHLQPDSQRYLQTIMASARRMGMLIDDLLMFSRLGRKPLAKQKVDMHDLVSSVVHELSAEKLHIELPALPDVSGDPALLRQVWVNLLSNAIKYSAPRGDQARIEISGETKDDHVHYRVKDNGVGFDMRYADKLFGVFQRMHQQDQFEGTGVGLAIVHRIIGRHGGKISAIAEKDKGACFAFDLPVSEVASEQVSGC